MKRSAALTVSIPAALFVTLLTWSCAGPVPPVPTVSVDGLDPEVRDAILTAQKQAVAEPSSGQASGRLGMVLQAHSIYPPAVLSYQRAIRLEPKEFAWPYYLAVVLQQLAQPDKALAQLTAALGIRPDYAAATLRKGDLLFSLGRVPESGEAYKSLLSADPGSAAALYGLGRVKYAQNDMTSAADFYSRACRAYPTFGAAYYGLAMAQRSLKQEAEATKNFALAQRYSGDNPQTPDSLGDEVAALATGVHQHLDQGDKLARKGRPEEAARLNEAMLERDPDNFTVILNLLYLARFLERLDGQVDDFYARAKRINPDVPLIYDYYGAVLARQGKFEAAMTALRKAVELRPDFAEAHSIMGEILERQNRPDEAIAHYQRALAAQANDSSVQIKLWRMLIIRGKGRETIPQLLAALNVDDPSTSMKLVLLGEAYRTTGEMGKSRQYLEQALTRVRSEGPAGLQELIEQELKQLPPRP